MISLKVLLNLCEFHLEEKSHSDFCTIDFCTWTEIKLIYEKMMLKQNSFGSAFSMFLHVHACLVASVVYNSLRLYGL